MEWRIFSGIPEEDVRAVLALARRSTYRRGEVVFHRHDPADAVHLVTKGRFDVRVTTSHGDEVALAIRGPGETLGELAVVTEAERSATVTALEPAETLVVRGAELRRLAQRHASLDEVLVRLLAERVAFLSERLVEAYTVDAETRVARRVLELGRVYGRTPPITIPLIQDDLAALAGTSRATVNRVLRDAERRGLVELGRGRTVLFDPDGIARLARVPPPQAGSPVGVEGPELAMRSAQSGRLVTGEVRLEAVEVGVPPAAVAGGPVGRGRGVHEHEPRYGAVVKRLERPGDVLVAVVRERPAVRERAGRVPGGHGPGREPSPASNDATPPTRGSIVAV